MTKEKIQPNQTRLVSLKGESQFAEDAIISRTLLSLPNGRVVLFTMSEGQEMTEHTSSKHALVQLISGSCEFSVPGKAHNLEPNDLFYMPPGTPHALKAITPVSFLLTLINPEDKPANFDAGLGKIGKAASTLFAQVQPAEPVLK